MKDNIQKYNKKIFGYYLFDLIGFGFRIILGVIFLIAALEKIPHMNLFRSTVANYHILPVHIVPIFSAALPWFELILGIYLLIGIYIPLTMKITIAFLLVFMVAMTFAILTNQPVTGCGCFAQSTNEKLTWFDDIRDALFVLLAFFVLYTNNTLFSLDSYLHKQRSNS